jgi:hypothetical protein
MKVLCLIVALIPTMAFASHRTNCNEVIKAAALDHMKKVDSTGHFSISEPYYFSPNEAYVSVDDHSAFGTFEFDVTVNIDSACRIVGISAECKSGGDVDCPF